MSSSLGAWTSAIAQLVRRDIKVRYKNSALGFVWSFLNPLMQVLVMTIAVRYIMEVGVKNFSAELLTCLLPWMFFSQSLSDGAACVPINAVLVKKYRFPRVILPISTLTANFVHLLLGLLVLVSVFVFHRVHITWSVLWMGPLLLIQCVLSLSLMMMLSVLQVFYDDVRFVAAWGLQLLFFLSPILYTVEQVMNSGRLPDLAKELYLLANPLAPLLVGYRTVLLHGGEWPITTPLLYVGASAAWAVVLLGIAWVIWRRHEWQFPELL